MNKKKIFNDPVYGFITLPYPIIFDIIEHPFFQRLRRISQTGFTQYVYPGATHSRFNHALGALHLMTQAIETLRSKGIQITEDEAEAACIAILMHDIGHGPFSHALENILINIHHEELSLWFMEAINEELNGRLQLAISIFKNEYHKKFLHQLVSGQLDLDRMDYLNRDSFFTGVSEGIIGYDRIIKMLTVVDNQIVVEEKGIYSIENFLIARRLMYWQAYLHKTSIVAEKMLVNFILRLKQMIKLEGQQYIPDALLFFLTLPEIHQYNREYIIQQYAMLDDYDIYTVLKQWQKFDDNVSKFLSNGLINRKLLKININTQPVKEEVFQQILIQTAKQFGWAIEATKFVVFSGSESNLAYKRKVDEIKILQKSGKTAMMSELSEHAIPSKTITKYFLCHPKSIPFEIV
ncbi:MAG: HD domain-containing protein [Saprospiraceae bacterium]|nr:HD domain-containing protein [Saprospiraceae bacterium]